MYFNTIVTHVKMNRYQGYICIQMRIKMTLHSDSNYDQDLEYFICLYATSTVLENHALNFFLGFTERMTLPDFVFMVQNTICDDMEVNR